MKEVLTKIRQIAENIDNIQTKTQLNSLLSNVQTNYDMLTTKLNLTTKQSINRKEKLGQAYQKLNDFENFKIKYSQMESQVQKLSKYHENVIAQKKMTNEKIKLLFNQHLTNQNSKDYQIFQRISTQFDFQKQDQGTYDKNLKNYELLELAGTFGNTKLINTNVLPKSSAVKTQTKSR